MGLCLTVWHVKAPLYGVVSHKILLNYDRCIVACDDLPCNNLCACWPTTDTISLNSDCLIEKEGLRVGRKL
jgi:hypothetical protein